MKSDLPYTTFGELAKRFPGLQVYQIRRLYERGVLPPAPRVAHMRVIPNGDVKKVVAALKKFGYLPPLGSGYRHKKKVMESIN